jgi:membrane-bound metal-dependent hydrolase YbcI (DUF457 family)
VLALASNLPDIDILTALTGRWDYFLMRRTFTHSVLGVPLLALAAALVERRIWPKLSFGTLFALNVLGMVLHVCFDLLNSYGVRPLYPFVDARYELAWVFIVDLALIALLAVPLLTWKRGDAERWARGTLAAVALYVMMCGGARAYAARLLDGATHGASYTYVFPEALGNHRFRGAVRRGDEWSLWQIRLPAGVCEKRATYVTRADDPAVRSVRATADARRLEEFYRAPVWEPAGEGCWRVFDLRFMSTVYTPRLLPFSYELDERGVR